MLTENLFSLINLGLVLTICALSYFIIAMFSTKSKSWIKKLITFLVGITASLFYYFVLGTELDVLLPSFSLAIVVYDYVIKYILRRFKVDYKSFANKEE